MLFIKKLPCPPFLTSSVIINPSGELLLIDTVLFPEQSILGKIAEAISQPVPAN